MIPCTDVHTHINYLAGDGSEGKKCVILQGGGLLSSPLDLHLMSITILYVPFLYRFINLKKRTCVSC